MMVTLEPLPLIALNSMASGCIIEKRPQCIIPLHDSPHPGHTTHPTHALLLTWYLLCYPTTYPGVIPTLLPINPPLAKDPSSHPDFILTLLPLNPPSPYYLSPHLDPTTCPISPQPSLILLRITPPWPHHFYPITTQSSLTLLAIIPTWLQHVPYYPSILPHPTTHHPTMTPTCTLLPLNPPSSYNQSYHHWLHTSFIALTPHPLYYPLPQPYPITPPYLYYPSSHPDFILTLLRLSSPSPYYLSSHPDFILTLLPLNPPSPYYPSSQPWPPSA